ncbi:MAG: Hsp20/alpha crystallin family protein [Chloroflexota bacterium]
MAVVKWSPLKELEDMRRDMDRLFDEFFSPVRRRRTWPARTEGGTIVPSIDLYDRKAEIVLKVELPGVSRENIELTITKESLMIKGEIKKDEDVKEEDYYVSERAFGSFSRTIALPVEVESEKAKAMFKDGVLEVALPKRQEAQPKEVKIEVK